MADPKIPNLVDILNTAKTTFNSVLPDIDLDSEAMTENAILSSVSNIAYSLQVKMNELRNLLVISNLTGQDLDNEGEKMGVPRLKPNVATGNVIFQSATITSVDSNTLFTINGNTYSNSNGADPVNYEFTIFDTVFDNANNLTIFTLVNTLDNNGLNVKFIPKMEIVLKNPPNTKLVILNVLSDTQFSVSGNVTQSANAIFTASSVFNINVTSTVAASSMNADPFSLVSSDYFSGINGYVDLGGIVGGRDLETDGDYVSRLLYRSANANKGIFNNFGFQRFLNTNGLNYKFKVLRGYDEVTLSSSMGTVYLLNPDGTVLTQGELDHIIDLFYNDDTGLAYPNDSKAHPTTKFLSPVITKVNIVINNLQPAYPSLMSAIKNSLLDYFTNKLAIGQSADYSKLQSIINDTVDSAGNSPEEFVLLSPSADVPCALNEKLTLNNDVKFGN